jgi:hypothetical protein
VSTRETLREQLVADGLAGWVATPRSNSLDHFRRLAAGEVGFQLGLDLGDRWPYERVVELMGVRCGRPAAGWDEDGPDYIDPELTLDALDRMAAVLRRAPGRRVLLATGHPHGLLAVHLALARALAAAGAVLVTVPPGLVGHDVKIDQLGGVAVVHSSGSLRHTHSARWMAMVLRALPAPPELVVADHGWAGCAGARCIETVGFADCNDPALFAGESEGSVAVTVPLDDGLRFGVYGPLTDYLMDGAFGTAR